MIDTDKMMDLDKHYKSDNGWVEKYQKCHPMSEWYKVHAPSSPHIAAIWKIIETAGETNGKIPSDIELAYKHGTSFDSVRRILRNFTLAGGVYERRGKSIVIVAMPRIKPQPEPLSQPEPQTESTVPEITLRDIYDKLSELIELTRSVWTTQECTL